MKRSTSVAILAAALTLAPRARAEATAEDRAMADQLYEDGGNLMRASRWAEACPKLEASQKLDPAIGTAVRLAYCYAGEEKNASAWAMFHDAEAMARRRNDRRADDAAKQAKLLEAKLARLLFTIAPENGTAGLEIRRDGKVIDPAAWSTAAPVDPGEHTIEAVKPGKQAWQTTITIETKPGVATVSIPALVDAPVAPVALPQPDVSPAAPAAPFWNSQRVAGLSVGAAGVVGIVMGAAFGIKTLQSTSSAKAYCSPTEPYCQPAGVTLENNAKTTAKVSDTTFAIGGAAVGGGLLLFFTAPLGGPKAAGTARITPVVGIGRAGIMVEGRW